MPADHDEQARVEAACAELAAAGQPVTFAEVAARGRISRTTLYRRADLRAVIEEHRARGRDATTLSGLAVQIDQLRRSLEAVAAKVRRHEETIRRRLVTYDAESKPLLAFYGPKRVKNINAVATPISVVREIVTAICEDK